MEAQGKGTEVDRKPISKDPYRTLEVKPLREAKLVEILQAVVLFSIVFFIFMGLPGILISNLMWRGGESDYGVVMWMLGLTYLSAFVGVISAYILWRRDRPYINLSFSSLGLSLDEGETWPWDSFSVSVHAPKWPMKQREIRERGFSMEYAVTFEAAKLTADISLQRINHPVQQFRTRLVEAKLLKQQLINLEVALQRAKNTTAQ